MYPWRCTSANRRPNRRDCPVSAHRPAPQPSLPSAVDVRQPHRPLTQSRSKPNSVWAGSSPSPPVTSSRPAPNRPVAQQVERRPWWAHRGTGRDRPPAPPACDPSAPRLRLARFFPACDRRPRRAVFGPPRAAADEQLGRRRAAGRQGRREAARPLRAAPAGAAREARPGRHSGDHGERPRQPADVAPADAAEQIRSHGSRRKRPGRFAPRC